MMEQDIELPVLQHPETQLLYTEGLKLSPEVLQNILALPRPTLIADLEAILADTKERSGYYELLLDTAERTNFQDAALHAIMLLGELKATESLPVILTWLTASMDFTDMWLGDHLTETLWEPLYKLLPGNAEAVEAFLTNTQAYEFARGAMTDALAQLVMHQPEQRPWVLSIFQKVFEYYLQLPNGTFEEETFMGLVIHEAEDIEAIELWPVIEQLFDAGRVDEFAAGTKADALKEIQQPDKPDYRCKEVLPLQERYQKITTTWYGYTGKESDFIGLPDDMMEDDDWADWEEADEQEKTHPVRTAPKIGRNDPCPCGSGKKYKKCCLSKLEG